MSETKELQRFKRDYDFYAYKYRQAIQAEDKGSAHYWLNFILNLDSRFADIDRANDEHVETVLEEVER